MAKEILKYYLPKAILQNHYLKQKKIKGGFFNMKIAKRIMIILISNISVLSLLFTIAVPTGLAEKKDIYRVEMRGTNFGGIFYVLGFGAIDILNKNSDWIRGSAVESSGSTENIKLVGKSPQRRARSVFIAALAQKCEAKKGIPPFDDTPEKYKDVMVILSVAQMGYAVITRDPKITSLSDLKGKKVSTWPKGSAKFMELYSFISGAGDDVVNSIDWQFTQYQGYEDLLVGKVDAVGTNFPMVEPGKFAPGLKFRELLSRTNDLHIVGATLEQRELTRKKIGEEYGISAVLPSDSIKPGIPDKNILINLGIGAWSAYPEIPDEVIYEMLSRWKTHYQKFAEYHPIGKTMIPSEWGLLPLPKEDFHPGARKFYEDNNIPYGIKAFEKKQKELLRKMGIDKTE